MSRVTYLKKQPRFSGVSLIDDQVHTSQKCGRRRYVSQPRFARCAKQASTGSAKPLGLGVLLKFLIDKVCFHQLNFTTVVHLLGYCKIQVARCS